MPFYLDKVFHRFPQAFVPGVGWVDFDPTRTDRANNKRLFFGQTPGPMLLLCVGDGGEGSLTGWDYLEAHAWTDEKARASSLRQAWWFTPPPPDIRKQVARLFAQEIALMQDPRSPRKAFDLQSRILREAFREEQAGGDKQPRGTSEPEGV